MFDREFYPTPRHVLDMMQIDCSGKIVLEPSAGSGAIVDYLIENGSRKVVACEKHPELRRIAATKCQLIANDFFELTPEQSSHVQMIVMNPPFSNAVDHILHAWNIAPEGCEILSLCNYQTVGNSYSSRRNELSKIISDYGNSVNLGPVFEEAERTTSVEIGLIKLYKPISTESTDFEGFYLGEDEEPSENGIMRFNEVRSIVNSYIGALKCYSTFLVVASDMNRLTSNLGVSGVFSVSVGYNNSAYSEEDFARKLQIQAWKSVFQKLNLDKYVTSGVMRDINNFVENQSKVPFTVRNVYRMLDIIAGTLEQTMNRAIVEAVDKITRHTHENRFGVEGWKTNAGHLLTKKFIAGGFVDHYPGEYYVRIKDYYSSFEKITDLTKALCYLTGLNYNSVERIEQASLDRGRFCPNTWYSWGFFEFKVFKKGTGHFKFKDEKVWELLNRRYAKIKGQVLPEKM